MQLSFFAVDVADPRRIFAVPRRPICQQPTEKSPDDCDDADEEAPPAENRDTHWWRDFGADFDDDEPEPEPGDFWPESDDT